MLANCAADKTRFVFGSGDLEEFKHGEVPDFASAAQFIHDQHDAVALIASQDGRFTVFEWSDCEGMVHAHRLEVLLL